MFGRSKTVTFYPYGRRRSRWRPPRWLVLLLGGVAVGTAAVLFVQERYLPPRLTAEASERLESAYRNADADRARLETELGETKQRLERALAEQAELTRGLAASQGSVKRLQDDLAFVVDALPPDPRGGTVEVRAARFATQGGMLVYDVVLTRERAGQAAVPGVMRVVVAGASAQGSASSATLKPVGLTLGAREVLRGSLALPEGFRPQQATVQVLDRAEGRLLGTRVLLVR